MRAERAGHFVLGALALAWVGAALCGYDVVADVHPADASLGPAADRWLGTDHMGRDVAWRLLVGTASFVPPGILAAAVAGLAGGTAGAAAGWFGGAVEAAVRYALSVVASVPRLVLVLLACSILSSSPWVLGAAAGVAYAPALGEAVYTRIEGLRRAEFVLAARAHGLADTRILFHHLLWVNCRGLVARHLLQAFGFFLVLESTLSYLGGFGVQEPTPSWGNMLAFEFGVVEGNPLAWAAPALAIWGVILASTWAGGELRGGDDGR